MGKIGGDVAREGLTKFRFIDHTADAGFIAYGRDPEELFCNAAEALLALITDLDLVRSKCSRPVKVTASGLEELLVCWLQELLYLFDVENMLFRDFRVIELKDDMMRAQARGERFDERRHIIHTTVKAVTYHGLEVKRSNGVYTARVIVDI